MTTISAASPTSQFCVHDLRLKLRNSVPLLDAALADLIGTFRVDALSETSAIPEGTIRPYDESEVVRRLPAAATRVSAPGDLMELFAKDECYWLIDDRWGMAEVNLLRGQWRSWVLPQPSIDAIRTAELAVLWPLAQLLRPRGLCLLPGISIVRDGWGAMILAPFNLEPELSAIVRAGWRIIGQRWTALREDQGRVAMLHMPGQVERALGPSSPPRVTAVRSSPPVVWIDLTREFAGASHERAGCDAVMLVERGRRPVALVRPVARASALTALRRAWPIVELHPHRRHGQLLAAVSRQCRVFEMRLSRTPADVLKLLDDARCDRTPMVQTTVVARARRVVA